MSTETRTPIEDIAADYLARIKRDNLKVLNFFPFYSMNSTAAKTQLLVLEKLTDNKCYLAKTKREKLRIATQAAIDAGYTIREVQ